MEYYEGFEGCRISNTPPKGPLEGFLSVLDTYNKDRRGVDSNYEQRFNEQIEEWKDYLDLETRITGLLE